ncbi:MAG: putative oxidoreductase, nitronate monooxygenase family [Burkholderiaceae bacterium]|nr:MAG: putative oxidoreductase, nitronate monooxygenase family [Burkholderiaceae bacterium]
MEKATIATRLTERLDIRCPVISAGMGGPARSELAAAVSEAGGFGLLGMVREPPALIETEIAAVMSRTSRPFGVNLIPFATDPKLLQDELAVCFNARVPAMCFFWEVDPRVIAQAKKAGSLVLYQVGSLEDALLAESAGADVVIVQGVEAGGHVKGTLPLAVMLPEVVDKLKIPVVASGGIATGRSIAAALALGADGVHCGTAFLASEESFAHEFHKRRIVEAKPGDTILTDLFAINWPPNSPVRVLRNSVSDGAADHLWGNHPDRLPREVIGYEGERPIYKYSTDSPLKSMTGDFEKMGLFAGESAGFVNAIQPAARVLETMMEEAVLAIRNLNGALIGRL